VEVGIEAEADVEESAATEDATAEQLAAPAAGEIEVQVVNWLKRPPVLAKIVARGFASQKQRPLLLPVCLTLWKPQRWSSVLREPAPPPLSANSTEHTEA
jgi:hypothetical protein